MSRIEDVDAYRERLSVFDLLYLMFVGLFQLAWMSVIACVVWSIAKASLAKLH